jgi:predicted ester cyclase
MENEAELRRSAQQASEAGRVHLQIFELTGDGRIEDALDLVDADVIDHRGGAVGTVYGIAAWSEKWNQMYRGSTNFSVRFESNISSGDQSANRYTFRGTDPATGRTYEVLSLDVIRVRNGKMIEHWGLLDHLSVQHQLSLPE